MGAFAARRELVCISAIEQRSRKERARGEASCNYKRRVRAGLCAVSLRRRYGLYGIRIHLCLCSAQTFDIRLDKDPASPTHRWNPTKLADFYVEISAIEGR